MNESPTDPQPWPTTHLRIASLNYSGVLSSPYEFYQNEDEIELRINKTFTHYVKEKYPQFVEQNGKKFKWNMESLDLRWKNRYCPVTVIDVGVNLEKNTMMNQEEFVAEWNRIYEQSKEKIKNQYFNKKYKPEEVQQKMKIEVDRCRQFDLFCYRALIKVYSGIDDINKMENVDAVNYMEHRKKDFNKPYLCQTRKINKTLEFINSMKYDILYFQETNHSFVTGIQGKVDNYHVTQDPISTSVLFVKKSICPQNFNFQKQNQIFLQTYSQKLKQKYQIQITPQQLRKKLLFNDDSIFQVLDNMILVNVHLSSKLEKNSLQVIEMSEQLKKINTLFPQYHLIYGGDFNATIDNKIFQNLGAKIQQNKTKSNKFTVKKKRSMMQVQRHKAEKMDQTLKDYIFSTLQIVKDQITLIDEKNIQQFQKLPLLPQAEHPYDHFLVTVTLKK